MAKIKEEIIIIKLSKLMKKDAELKSSESLVSDTLLSGLDIMVNELIDDSSVIVELESASYIGAEE